MFCPAYFLLLMVLYRQALSLHALKRRWSSLYSKKTNLDPTKLNNYRPILKLPFLHKVLEKVVINQISLYLNSNDILDPFQSGFRAKYSTESALLRVVNDILLSADCGNSYYWT